MDQGEPDRAQQRQPTTDSHQSQKQGETTGRRGALASLARGAGMLLLVGGGGWLLGRRGRGANADGTGAGPTANPCSRCASLFSCLLPLAESARRQGIGLAGSVRRAADGQQPRPADVNCDDGRQAAAGTSDNDGER